MPLIDQLRLVQTSMLGSILSNLLLVLGKWYSDCPVIWRLSTGSPNIFFAGCSFAAGGFVYSESQFRQTAAQTSASLMTLSCITLVIPAACKTLPSRLAGDAHPLFSPAQTIAPIFAEMPKTELTHSWLNSWLVTKTRSMHQTPRMIPSRAS